MVMRDKVNVSQLVFLGDRDVAPVGNEVYGFRRAEFCEKTGVQVSQVRELQGNKEMLSIPSTTIMKFKDSSSMLPV